MGDGIRIRKSWAHEKASLSSKYPAMHQSRLHQPRQPKAAVTVGARRLGIEHFRID
jgi:hypothetical protein